jgi:hypothetical protein
MVDPLLSQIRRSYSINVSNINDQQLSFHFLFNLNYFKIIIISGIMLVEKTLGVFPIPTFQNKNLCCSVKFSKTQFGMFFVVYILHIFTSTTRIMSLHRIHENNLSLHFNQVSNNLIDLVALSVEWNVNWGNWEFVFVDGSNWELVDVDGGNGQVGALGFESLLISGPGQSEFLAFGGDPVRRSLVGVSHNILVGGFAVRVVCDALHLLLDLGFLAGGVVGLGVAVSVIKGNLASFNRSTFFLSFIFIPPLAAAIEVALIRLAGDGDVGVFVILVRWGRVGRCGVSWGRVGWFGVGWGRVGGWLVLLLIAGRSSGSDGQDSGDNKLKVKNNFMN